MNVQSETSRHFSRRGFLGLTAAAAAVPLLAACGGGSASSSGSSGTIKFWDMPWGTPAYNDAAKKLVEGFSGANSKASYQIIQWNNFYQTFSSAIASKTGPAVSTGGGFQAFQFEQQGQIAYADKVIDALKKNGQFDDFLPGVLDPFKSDKGYVAVPWQLDMRPLWYRKSLFDKAGASVPTDWPSLLEAGKKLKSIGAVGFATGSGAGNNIGNHLMIMMMINNGGGVWTKDGQLDVMNDRNVEAVEFLLELVSNGVIDPAAVSYTTDNLDAQWKKDGKAAFGMYVLGLDKRVGDTSGDLLVASPMAGPHGDKATLVFPNNIMMYKNTPSQDASEAFLTYYMGQIKELWRQKLMNGLPVFKSITELPEFAGDPNNVKIVKEYQPIAKTFAAQGTSLNANLAVLDGGQALNQFTQTILTGKTDAKTALAAFQSGLQSVIKK
ncbi:ABC transporter substrate-binding protein [Arthrobacter bambusae]|uniref:ABC transporter substrate-binding protein n=1 Tax=Arthrobacter bambusae TaxID=1338426 RepID=UPI00278AD703|nr:extracellular solute-binding protein [Arthrobacter bambusae]MDQ0031907.1 multiple sugar transport system substrate-binding protein [Arthrobacter bambusae]MDQ0100064.1 multiple sugar transport system substrate-binding protein [Arthrobacter bambusae]